MKNMQELANDFARRNRGKGVVSKVTSYCFWWEEFSKKKNGELDLEKPNKTTVYMKSYFLEFNK